MTTATSNHAPAFAFQWHITDECDQRCKHCYIFAEGECAGFKRMPWEQMVEVVDQAEALCKNIGRQPYFYVTGGDPILHPDFWRNCSMSAGSCGASWETRSTSPTRSACA